MFYSDIQKLSLTSTSDNALTFLNDVSDLISSNKWKTSKELFDQVFLKAKDAVKFGKTTSLIFVILKVLKIIRVECARVLSGNPELEEQASNLLFAGTDSESKEVLRDDLKEYVIESMSCLQMEMEDAKKLIKKTARSFIQNGDVIMTQGYSKLVLGWMETAIKKQIQFSVIVIEGPPNCLGAKMVTKLSKLGVPVVVASDRASFSLLSKTHKVVLEATTAFVDGAVLCTSGAHRLCLDAEANSVPVLILLPSYRLSPLFSCNYNYMSLEGDSSKEVFVPDRHDVVPADLIGSIITNLDTLLPAQLFSIARDSFYADDEQYFLSVV